MKNSMLMAIKVVVSLLSLYFVLRAADWPAVTETLGDIHPGIVLVALAVFWLAQIVSSLRFVYIAGELGGSLTLPMSLNAHFVGLWFNQVLPTGLGGDVLKVAVLRPAIGLGVAVKSALLDRFSGLFILMLAVAVTLPLYPRVIPRDQGAVLDGLAVLAISFLAATLVLAWGSTAIRARVEPGSWPSRLLGLASAIWLFRRGRPLWRQLWTSTIVHLNGVAAFGLLGVALGFDVDPLTYLLIVPLVFLVALLPISYAGWGVREAGAVWLFGLAGIPGENALVLSVAYGSLLILAGLPGLFVFVRNRRRDQATRIPNG